MTTCRSSELLLVEKLCTGTYICRRRTDGNEIPEWLAMIAEGTRINGVGRLKGYKEDTVFAWIRDAAEHTDAVEEIPMSEFRISREGTAVICRQ